MYKSLLIEPHFIPCIEVFCCISRAETIQLEVFEHYQKQTYRNRFYILGTNGVQSLSIPVIKPSGKVLSKDIKVDLSGKWRQEHWRSIQSAYGKSAFYEYFADYFEPLFTSTPKYLTELNHKSLSICLQLLQISKEITLTNKYSTETESEVLNARSSIIAKQPFEDRSYYQAYPYHQVFGKNFVPNLSILDLLMNEGPQSVRIVTKSIKSE